MSSLNTPQGLTLQFECQPQADDVKALANGLTEQAAAVLEQPGFNSVALFLRDANQQVVGGIEGLINWNWLHIRLFWLQKPLRGSGLGSQLLQQFEQEAAGLGCEHAHLDTFSWQARPFYERHGYQVFGELDNYPPGQQRFFMRKPLTQPTAKH